MGAAGVVGEQGHWQVLEGGAGHWGSRAGTDPLMLLVALIFFLFLMADPLAQQKIPGIPVCQSALDETAAKFFSFCSLSQSRWLRLSTTVQAGWALNIVVKATGPRDAALSTSCV